PVVDRPTLADESHRPAEPVGAVEDNDDNAAERHPLLTIRPCPDPGFTVCRDRKAWAGGLSGARFHPNDPEMSDQLIGILDPVTPRSAPGRMDGDLTFLLPHHESKSGFAHRVDREAGHIGRCGNPRAFG